MQRFGARYGRAAGRTGDAYAIPTKDAKLRTLPLDMIKPYINGFLAYARIHSDLKFQVTRIGCGLAGYTDEQIAPMFFGAPKNCYFDPKWEGDHP